MKTIFKAIFLDRDGVINRYPGDKKYVTRWEDFRFLPKAKKAIAKLHKNRFKIFIISNQAGVSKGIFTKRSLDFITRNMLREITKAKGKIDAVFYCIHHPDENCACRKPKAGLIDIARRKYPIDLKKSFFIGDTMRDIHTAQAAGCKSILVLSGKEKWTNRKNWQVLPDFVFSSLYQATEFILHEPQNQ
jgi:D-glycero-D-manno-heptose 1,7-bisphosphate phosphatase